MKMNYRATIREIIWFDNRKAAENQSRKAMDLVTPKVTYGVAGGDANWLAVPSLISPDGALFKLENLYINSEKAWDSEIYP